MHRCAQRLNDGVPLFHPNVFTRRFAAVGRSAGPQSRPRGGEPPARGSRNPRTLTRVREVSPQVFLIARPALDWEGVRAYLEAVGGTAWLERIRPDGHDDRGD